MKIVSYDIIRDWHSEYNNSEHYILTLPLDYTSDTKAEIVCRDMMRGNNAARRIALYRQDELLVEYHRPLAYEDDYKTSYPNR